jgi:EpsI family protein
VVLILQALLTYGMTRSEVIPEKKPISALPAQLGNWTQYQEGVVDRDTQSVLKADELLTRSYVRQGTPLPANLFIAYFKTQRTGQLPHSPKNCLPGSGWVPSVSEFVNVDIAGRDPIEVNRYLVAKGDSKSVVMYWYQSRDRVVASEYRARYYSILDAIQYNRSDTALVRVIVPVVNDDEAAATKIATDFIKASFTTIRQYFPA